MRYDKRHLRTALLALAVMLTPGALARLAQAATVTIVNLDGSGEGFNDPTPASPVGGNPGVTIGAQRLIAFQFAADLWGASLDSPVEVRVGAEFNPLSCNASSAVLGAAGAETVSRDFTGAPVANTWFPAALANSLAGQDLDPSGDDIGATFNSSFGTTCAFPGGWYYGLDRNPPAAQFDFVSVLLHEIGHGVGFQTLVDLSTGAKLSGRNDTFMLNLEDHATGKLYPDMTNAERVAASTAIGDLHWVGPHVVAAGGFLTVGRDPSGHVEMYAPFSQEPGSSVSHFSTALSPDELMEPFYTGPNHNLELTLELLTDIGWRLIPTQLGVYRDGQWYLDNGNGQWDGCGNFPGQDQCLLSGFGVPSDQAVTGDWDGDGITQLGVYRDGQWYLDNGNGQWDGCGSFPAQDQCLQSGFGVPSDQAVTGDWDGDGITQLGVYRDGQWYLDNGNGQWDGCGNFPAQDQCWLSGFGVPSDQAVTGDWDGDGITQLGVYRDGQWYLDNGNGQWDGCGNFPAQDQCWLSGFGVPSDQAVTGDWDGDGITQLGVYRNGQWYLDNGNGQWDGCGSFPAQDRCLQSGFGVPSDQTVTGIW